MEHRATKHVSRKRDPASGDMRKIKNPERAERIWKIATRFGQWHALSQTTGFKSTFYGPPPVAVGFR
ncbi:MAG: hypothetical protein J0J15_05445 [Mesorhizobium sp.]|nr:hypothetical protein [Mesorhizobium sp.]